MKIGCPNCGQHYEVDASSLERYFRCNECQTLFRGLNAKSIKTYEFKRKASDDQNEEIITDVAETTTINEDDILQLVDKDEIPTEAAVAPVSAPAEDKWQDPQPAGDIWDEPEEDTAERFSDPTLDMLKTYWLPAVAVIIIFLLILLCFILNSRLNDINSENRRMRSELKDLQTRVTLLEQAVDAKDK